MIITHRTETDADPAISKVERVIPLTESRRGFWTQGVLGPDAVRAYNVARTVKLTSPYDQTASQRAMLALVQRHEAMRTRIQADGGTQGIAQADAVTVGLADVRHLPESERDAIGPGSRGVNDHLKLTHFRPFKFDPGQGDRCPLGTV